MDLICQWGTMSVLFSDNAKVQTSLATRDILWQYMQSEPYQQSQNPVEYRIQEVKAMTNTVKDRSGSPERVLLLWIQYCVHVLSRLFHHNLREITSLAMVFRETPDISHDLLFIQPINPLLCPWFAISTQLEIFRSPCWFYGVCWG